MAAKGKEIPARLQAIIEKLPPAATLADDVVDPDFVQDLLRSGKAIQLEPGQKLPDNVEYEVRVENGKIRLIRHRVAAP